MSLRNITAATDIDKTASAARPLFRFQLTGLPIFVVFVHLKSGSETIATEEIDAALKEMNTVLTDQRPTLWVGDFNRAVPEGLTLKYQGGGQAKWPLDRVYVSNWDSKKGSVKVRCRSVNIYDHHHEGLEIDVEYKY